MTSVSRIFGSEIFWLQLWLPLQKLNIQVLKDFGKYEEKQSDGHIDIFDIET